MSGAKPNVWQRRRARRALVQAVYQWQIANAAYTSVLADFREGDALKKADHEFFEALLRRVLMDAASLDEAFESYLDRPLAQLDPVEQAILRLAAAEFIERIDVPYRVVIDEYVELAKTFGATDSHKYINGVLDAMAGKLRTIEVQAASSSP